MLIKVSKNPPFYSQNLVKIFIVIKHQQNQEIKIPRRKTRVLNGGLERTRTFNLPRVRRTINEEIFENCRRRKIKFTFLLFKSVKKVTFFYVLGNLCNLIFSSVNDLISTVGIKPFTRFIDSFVYSGLRCVYLIVNPIAE